MAAAPSQHDPPAKLWVVDCPRHGRASLVLRDLDQLSADVAACDVFPAGTAPSCDKACLKQFGLEPRPATSDELAATDEFAAIDELPAPGD